MIPAILDSLNLTALSGKSLQPASETAVRSLS